MPSRIQLSSNHAAQRADFWRMKKGLNKGIRYLLAIASVLGAQCVTAGQLQLGTGAMNSHSAIAGNPAETRFVPAIIYQGEKFSFVFDTLAYKLFELDSLSVSLTGQMRMETYKPKESDALNGMDKRDSAFDMGINVQSVKPWGTLELASAGDVSSTYDGYEVKTSYAYPRMIGRWLLKPEVGVSYLSRQLVDYYYGVKDSEQNVARPAFSGEEAINLFVNITAFYKLSAQWNVIGGMKYTYLDDAITKSPIVDESYEVTVFTAITYAF